MENGKVCFKCGEYKNIGDFHVNRSKKDGRNITCKNCTKAYRMKKGYINPKKDTHDKNGKVCSKCGEYKIYSEFYKNHTHKDGFTGQCKKCRDEYGKLYRQDKSNINYQTWNLIYENSNDRKKDKNVNATKRRSHKYKVNFTEYERNEILDRDKWTCQCCEIKVHDRSTGNWNTPDKAHIDHIVPISKGGDSSPENLQTLCRTCNLSKSNKVSKGH